MSAPLPLPAAADPVRIGVVGCGNISPIYFKTLRRFSGVEVVACSDLDPTRACARADEHPGVAACESVDALLADPAIEIVLNLTIPSSHAALATRALEAGKSVYGEKPLATGFEDGRRLVELAAARGLRLGSAPDTILGAGHQTCRRLVDEGAIGRPVAACAFMMGHGPDAWHPNPDFFYQPGGGPMFDMGPYHITALINLLGPVRRVTGSAQKAFGDERIIPNNNHGRRGQRVPVAIPTHIAAVLDFASGAVATLVTSFDVWSHSMPWMEIYGTEGSMSLPDPNTFGGPVRVRRATESDWQEMPLRPAAYAENSRGIGVADMAYAIRTGRPHRASGALALHVLEIMEAVHTASAEGRHVELTTTCERPVPMPLESAEGVFE